jgi:transcriptional regulator with XRE-family HTH domain
MNASAKIPYPNRLDELMLRSGMSGPRLAELADTSKQQLHKLRHGTSKMTRQWAERIAPHLGVGWREVMAVPARSAPPDDDPRLAELTAAIGRCLQWARSYRGLSLEAAATTFCIRAGRLIETLAGRQEMSVAEAVSIAPKLHISTDFLLGGTVGTLPDTARQSFRTYGEPDADPIPAMIGARAPSSDARAAEA